MFLELLLNYCLLESSTRIHATMYIEFMKLNKASFHMIKLLS